MGFGAVKIRDIHIFTKCSISLINTLLLRETTADNSGPPTPILPADPLCSCHGPTVPRKQRSHCEHLAHAKYCTELFSYISSPKPVCKDHLPTSYDFTT